MFNDAFSYLDADVDSRVSIAGSNTFIKADDTVRIEAREEFVKTETIAKATSGFGGLGGATAQSTNLKSSIATIDTSRQSNIEANRVFVEAFGNKANNKANYIETLEADNDTIADLGLTAGEGVVTVGAEIVCAWGLICDGEGAVGDAFDTVRGFTGVEEITTTTADQGLPGPVATGNVNFNTDIKVPGGISPILRVNSAGEIVEIENIDVIAVDTAGNQSGLLGLGDTFAADEDIVVLDITNDIKGEISIISEGALTGASVFDFNTAFETVTIINAAKNDLFLNDIEVENQNKSLPPAITIRGGAGDVSQRVNNPGPPSTDIQVVTTTPFLPFKTFKYLLRSNASTSLIDIRNTNTATDDTVHASSIASAIRGPDGSETSIFDDGAGYDITLMGTIKNPGGLTSILNESGDICRSVRSRSRATTSSAARSRSRRRRAASGARRATSWTGCSCGNPSA